MLPTLLGLAVLGRFHWVVGLVGAAIWLVWRMRTGRILVPQGWFLWLAAASGLVLSSALATRPSGMAWMGLLQWLSLGCGILALQDVLRERRQLLEALYWGILGVGVADGIAWLVDLFVQHRVWWLLRVDGLPTFPFRIRLFGSHGSTQSAVWLGFLILLAAHWAWPRIRSIALRVASIAIVGMWALLLGFCDSRLGLGAFAIAGGILAFQKGWTTLLPVLSLVPGAVWLTRDFVHPSRVSTGGGVDQAWIFLCVQIGFVLLGLVANRRTPNLLSGPRTSRILWAGVLLLPFLPPLAASIQSGALENWTTGRLAMWSVAIRSFLDHPILGVGPWGYVWEYAKVNEWGFAFLAMHPHNIVLDLLMAGGLVLLLPILVLLWKAGGWKDAPIDGTTGLLGGYLVLGMLFDSPMSSPQVRMAIMAILASRIRDGKIAFAWNAPPRSLVLLPLLVLVPIGFLLERQMDKIRLPEAGALLRKGDWESAARLVKDAGLGDDSDPQSLRNNLLARTALAATSVDSLRRLRPLWASLCRLEPGFPPNRVHLSWLEWTLSPDSSTRSRFEAELRNLWVLDQPEPSMGRIDSRWVDHYPTDDLAYWVGRLHAAESGRARAEEAWIRAWISHRVDKGGMVGASLGLNRDGFRIRPFKEEYLYGSSGSGWLLLPQVEVLLRRR